MVSREEQAILLATQLLEKTRAATRGQDKRRAKWFGKMLGDPKGKVFLTEMTDQCFRSHSNARIADQLTFLLKKFGTPSFMPWKDRIPILLFKLLGKLYPNLFVPLIKKHIRKEMSAVLLPKPAGPYFKACREKHIILNINHLGEAILGEEEAERRLNVYIDDLKSDEVTYVSIKISTIYSQINLVGWDHSLEKLAEKLRRLYTAAGEKFVNLDMEEYRDLDLTVALFKKVLSEPPFLQTRAGIALQSYLPDSFAKLQEITAWATERVAKGGAPIKVRLVKGANLAMEQVEGSLRGWEQAPFTSKLEADAHFKKMLRFAATPERARAVEIGVGSHNLFDIAYALVLRKEMGVEGAIGFEMLQGMAGAMQEVVCKKAGGLVLYCPDTHEEDFQHAVAYLVRRLDENTGPENFLRHLFDLRPGSKVWKQECARFKEAALKEVSSEKRRKQNRLEPPARIPRDTPFANEPDTDFSLEQNRQWVHEILNKWKSAHIPTIPLVVGGERIEMNLATGRDPSRPSQTLYMYAQADEAVAARALAVAKESEEAWATSEERFGSLAEAAHLMRERRGELLGAMIADGGKTVTEADTEISEAIDFIEYYIRSWKELISHSDLKWRPKGTVLVAPPWNFPCSIPTGGIAGALVAGNCVLFKPAPESVLVGWHVAQIFWDAGIPQTVLQFLNCPDDTVGTFMIKDPRLSTVVLTGATSTARKLLSFRPGLDLFAETGGKNALIITALADRDQAVSDLLASSFGHAGQKCSACSLAIVLAEVYDDPHFQRQLADAARSLIVGSAWRLETKVPPLIRPAEGDLLRGLTTLDEGESWLVKPEQDRENPLLWSPGIKLGVKEGSFMHQTELFGPVLGVMRASDLHEAIRFANGTPYGLTSGLSSLDERERAVWREKIFAGNLYINRTITGAIVRRQPFGGCKKSNYGAAFKAGGPNYLVALSHADQISLPKEKETLPPSMIPLIQALGGEDANLWKASAQSYIHWAPLFRRAQDPSKVIGQDNLFYHVPRQKVFCLRQPQDSLLDFLRVQAACLACETRLNILQDEELLVEKMKAGEVNRVRLLSPPTERLKTVAAELGIYLISSPVLANGRVELLHYLRSVSLSDSYHRYGNLYKLSEIMCTWTTPKPRI